LLTRNHRQEGLCRAYIQAVAARCGMSWSSPQPDYGIDMSLRDIAKLNGSRTESGYTLDVQAKATTRGHIRAHYVHCDIKVATYHALRLTVRDTPRILVVLFLPARETDWLAWTEDSLLVRRCAYWISLRDQPPIANRKSVRLAIPRSNVFSPAGLREIMERIKRRGKL
jgi:hypothetical protein